MKFKIFTLVFFFLAFYGFSQENKSNDRTSDSPYKNHFKMNVTSLLLRNFQFQYERSLSRKTAIAFGIGVIPKGGIPMKNSIENYVSDNDVSKNIIDPASISYFSFTPEFRWYAGKGYGKGFYIAPFYRYSEYKVEGIKLEYSNSLGIDENFDASGKVKTNTFGLLLGSQFKLGKRVSLDWWILGPNIGFGKGDISGAPSRPLSQTEQDQIRKELEDIDIPFVDEEVKVSSNKAQLIFDGNWGGIRSGLCIGFNF